MQAEIRLDDIKLLHSSMDAKYSEAVVWAFF